MDIELKAGPNDAGRRLDRILRKALPDYSLSLIHRLLRQGKIRVNGKSAGPDQRIRPGAVIQVETQDTAVRITSNTPSKSAPPPPLPEILWRGSGIIVFNKPSGLATHGVNSLDTLVTAHLSGKLPPSLSFKPGPLHRLDRPTSGIIAFSETLEGARLFSRLLREHRMEKTYLTIVEGDMQGEEVWEDVLVRNSGVRKTFVDGEQVAGNREQVTGNSGRGQKAAFTSVRGITSSNGYSLLEVRIASGRTHQIRSQAAAHGYPLAGDTKYGGHAIPAHGGFFLHAWKLDANGLIAGFPRPLVAPLPEAFLELTRRVFGTGLSEF